MMNMNWLECLKGFFDNQSVGAFVGAFSAFILVVLNDRRRDNRKVGNITAEIEMCLAHARGKLESVRRNRTLMREQNRLVAAPILQFNTALIRQLTAEVLSRLILPQRRAIDGLCYTMEATDQVLEAAYQMAKALSGPLGQAERTAMAERLLLDYEDAIVNLKRLMEMCENYVGKKYDIIVSKQYDRQDYEER